MRHLGQGLAVCGPSRLTFVWNRRQNARAETDVAGAPVYLLYTGATHKARNRLLN